MVATFVFYLFSIVVTASAVAVIFSKNPVHSVLWLILAFFNAAGLFVLLGAEFLAMVLVIVYVGAVAVLFLFVVMMLDIDFGQLRSGMAKYAPFGLLLGGVLLAELVVAGTAWSAGGMVRPAQAGPPIGSIRSIGDVLYTQYLFVFQTSGLVLLVALIGAIVLTHRQRGGVRRQSVEAQVSRTPMGSIVTSQPPVGAGVSITDGTAVSGTPALREPAE